MVTAEDVLTSSGRHPERMDWVSPAVQQNALETAKRVSALLLLFGANRILTSGFRDPDSNKRLSNAAPYSRHMYGQAVDIEDTNGALKDFVIAHADALANCGLWDEPHHLTPTWLHVQTVPLAGGSRK